MTALKESHEADQIEAIRHACLVGDGIDPVNEAITLRLRNHGLATGDRLWLQDEAGFLLSFAEGEHHRDLTLAVRPDARGQGTGRDLLGQCLASVDDVEAECSAWSHGDHPAAAALARATGFDRARALWVMRRPMDPADRVDPSVGQTRRPAKPGIKIRSYQPDDAEALITINAAAFADHPEQGGMDATNLAERMAEPWFDATGLLIAVDASNQLVGFHWTKIDRDMAAQTGQLVGEVYVIGVSPAAHGQGVGRQLMDAGLEHLARQGCEQVILYVESVNAPAIALYESLGFTHDDRDTHVLYRRPPRGAVVT